MKDIPFRIHAVPEAHGVGLSLEGIGLDKDRCRVVVEVDQALASMQVFPGVGEFDSLMPPVLIGHCGFGVHAGYNLGVDGGTSDFDLQVDVGSVDARLGRMDLNPPLA